MSRKRVEVLPNGLIRVDHRGSGLVSLLNADGSFRDGPVVGVCSCPDEVAVSGACGHWERGFIRVRPSV